MDNEQDGQTDQTSGDVTSSPQAEGSGTTALAETQESQETAGNTPEGTVQTEEQDLSEDGVVEFDGKEYIPKDAFLARINKLTAQKHDAIQGSALTEQILSDPQAVEKFRQFVKQELKETAGSSVTESAEKTDPLPTYRKWRSNIQDPAWGSLLDNFVGALMPDFESAVQSYVSDEITSALAPFKNYIGENITSTFFKGTPEAEKYRPQILQEMKSSGVPIEKAWKIIYFDQAVKLGRNTQAQKIQQEKMRPKPPIAGPGTRSVPAQSKAKTLDEGINRAFDRLGIK